MKLPAKKKPAITEEQGRKIVELLESTVTGLADLETAMTNCLKQLKVGNALLSEISDQCGRKR